MLIYLHLALILISCAKKTHTCGISCYTGITKTWVSACWCLLFQYTPNLIQATACWFGREITSYTMKKRKGVNFFLVNMMTSSWHILTVHLRAFCWVTWGAGIKCQEVPGVAVSQSPVGVRRCTYPSLVTHWSELSHTGLSWCPRCSSMPVLYRVKRRTLPGVIFLASVSYLPHKFLERQSLLRVHFWGNWAQEN